MTFETKRIALDMGADPVDLAADTDIGLEEFGQTLVPIVVQNVSTRTVRYAEVTAAPVADSVDVGHTIAPGAGVEFVITFGRPLWFWSATGATIAVSEGSPLGA